MLVLGIESSCDETGLALYDSNENRLIAQALHTQIAMHSAYGGVVPELASRDHITRLIPLLESCLKDSNKVYENIDAIAYTKGPGLIGTLLVGASFAHGLAFSLDKPLIEVHHLEGHLLSPMLSALKPQFPFIALLVSGGHTQIIEVKGIGEYIILGESVDDAAGEAFDKTAKLLGLSYPGGAKLAELAKEGKSDAFPFPRPMIQAKNLNMSFSGLKTAVLTEVKKLSLEKALSDSVRADLCASFQQAVIDVLLSKVKKALKLTKYKQLVIAGGVGANKELRRQFQQLDVEVFFPEIEWCTDNGAMIALAGAMHLNKLKYGDYSFSVKPRWPLIEYEKTLHCLSI